MGAGWARSAIYSKPTRAERTLGNGPGGHVKPPVNREKQQWARVNRKGWFVLISI